MALPVFPSREQQIINATSSYGLQSLFESTAAAGIAITASVIDPISATIYAVSKFAFGLPLNYVCDQVFEGPAASTASKVISYILKTAVPLLVAFGAAMLIGYPIGFTAMAYLSVIAAGVAAITTASQKLATIFELGYAQYKLLP